MSDSRLVWLPFDPADLGADSGSDPGSDPGADGGGDFPGLRFEQVDPTVEVADSVGEVRFYVPPYQMGPHVGDVLPQMTSLEVVQTISAGVDAIRDRVPEGVTLCNGRGVHDTSTAELALTLVLASLRDVPGFVRAAQRHEWTQSPRPALADKQVLIVGAGSIGRAITERLAPFEVETTLVARTARDGVHPIEELPELLPGADVVILIVPLTQETGGLFDAAMLARMKDGALLVNLARGPVVVTDDLLAELGAGRLTAALDVFDPEPVPADSPLWEAPGLLMTPHVGGASSAMWPRALRLLRSQLQRYAAGEPLDNVMSGDY